MATDESRLSFVLLTMLSEDDERAGIKHLEEAVDFAFTMLKDFSRFIEYPSDGIKRFQVVMRDFNAQLELLNKKVTFPDNIILIKNLREDIQQQLAITYDLNAQNWRVSES